MAILLPASDLGFIISSTEVAADDGIFVWFISLLESICIDGIDFPKYIPEPVFEEESSLHFVRYPFFLSFSTVTKRRKVI